MTQPSPDLGVLPEWRLDDLYAGIDSPQFPADMGRIAVESASRIIKGETIPKEQLVRIGLVKKTPASK